jgi:AcrR family transcriptional regulator
MSASTVQIAPRRLRDPAATRQSILDAAFIEFSDNGLSGARVDAIAARANTAVRMIYYYFGSKDGLYRSVLERGYAAIRAAEGELGLDKLPPVEAICRLTGFVFDYEEANPRFVRLVSIENIHRAEQISQSQTIRKLNDTVIVSIATILERGKHEGVFRSDAEPIDVHLLMTGFCFFRVANRYTLATVFGKDPVSPKLRERHRRMLVDSVLGYLCRPQGRA